MEKSTAAMKRGGGEPTVTEKSRYTTADNTVENISPETIISKSTYRDGVYSVSAVDGGGINVSQMRGQRTGSEHDSNSRPEYSYSTNGAYINAGKGGFNSEYKDERDKTVTKGVNWDNVKFVTGDTYKLRTELKALGFKWNGANKRWEK